MLDVRTIVPSLEPLRGRMESISAKKSWCTVSHIMVTSLRSKWSVGWGSVSAGRRIGVSASGSKAAFRHRYNDHEVSTELMMLCKRRHADTPIRFPSRAARPKKDGKTGQGKSLSSDSTRARSQRQQKEASRRAAPDARERIPPMGVVKRGLWAWRLFHFLMRRSRDVCGDAQRAHLPQCSATQASRTNTHQQKVFALQSPRNPKRATRSGVEEKNGISAEGRAKRVMPDFFFHSATRCAT